MSLQIQDSLYKAGAYAVGFYAIKTSEVLEKLWPAQSSEVSQALMFGTGEALISEAIRYLMLNQRTYIQQGLYSLVVDEAVFTGASLEILRRAGLDVKIFELIKKLNIVELPNEVVWSTAMGVIFTIISTVRDYLSAYYARSNQPGMYFITNPATMLLKRAGLA